MSSSRREILALLMATALPGCGLRPLYGDWSTAGPVNADLRRVEIATIADREGQLLRNELIDRFYTGAPPEPPAWRLDVGLTVTETRINLRSDTTATRRLLSVAAGFRIVRYGTWQPVLTGRLTANSTYPFQDSQYGILVAKDTALREIMVTLGDQLTTRVALYFARRPPEEAVEAG